MSVVLATAGYDHKIRFWEAPSGVCSRMIKYPDSQVNRLEITPDKQFIAAAGNPLIRLYEIFSSSTPTTGSDVGSPATSAHNQQQQPPQQAVLTLEGHTSNVTCIGFQKDGRYLYSGSEDGTIKVWDLRNPNYSRSFHSGGAVHSVCLRADRDEFISGDANGCVKVWDLGASGTGTGSGISASSANGGGGAGSSSSAQKRNTKEGDGCINCVKPSAAPAAGPVPPNGGCGDTVASSSTFCTFHYAYASSSAAYSVPIQSVDISEDSRTLVAVTNHGTVFVWDPSGSSSNSSDPANNDPAGAAGVTGELPQPQDSTISNYSKSSHFQGAHLLRPITKFRAHAPGSYCLHARIAPDCRHLVTTGSDGLAKLWDTTTWDLTERLQCCTHTGTENQNPAGGAAEGGMASGGGTAAATQPRSKWVWDAAFCADSSYLVTASSDHIARLWNLRTGEVVRKYHGHQSAVTCVALNDSSV